MHQNPQYLREAQIFLYLKWISFNALGWAVGLVMVIGAEKTIRPWHLYGVISLFLGIGQWVVLRRYLSKPSAAWIGTTVIGFIVGQQLAQTATRLLRGDGIFMASIGGGLVFGGLIGVLLGLAVGLAQLMLFRKHLIELRFWLITNMVGWGLGFQASSLMGGARFEITSLIATILCSAITGFVVMRLLGFDE